MPDAATTTPRAPVRWLDPLLIAAAFMAMAAWTWNKWPDVLVDFGRELYIAWQLSTGKHLYTDIAYYSGPLSPYLNALWFKLFGVGLHTLTTANLIILAAFIALLYRMMLDIADRLAATVGCLVFILLFAFAQYVGIGNYNWVCPYSHDLIHGIMLGCLSLFSIGRFNDARKSGWLIASCLTLGLALLTRSEVFVAAFLALVSSLILGMRVKTLVGPATCPPWRNSRSQPADPVDTPSLRSAERGAAPAWRSIVVFILCFLTPPAIAVLLLARGMPASQALTGVLGTWPSTLSGRVASMSYFRESTGTDDLAKSVWKMLGWTAGYGALVIPAAAVAMLLRSTDRNRWGVALSLFIAAAAGLLVLWWNAPPILDELRPLPLLLVLTAILWLVVLIRKNRARSTPSAELRGLCFCLFALGLLGKIILNCRIFHYGAFLAAPAALVLVAAMLCWIPQLVTRRGGYAGALQAAMLGAMTAFVIVHLRVMAPLLAAKTCAAGVGADFFWTDRRGVFVGNALHEIEARMKPGEGLVVVPEGVMVNYLSRRLNPTSHTNFMPTEMVIFGEDRILAEFKSHPPDWVAFIPKDTSEFGARFFGADYAQRIGQWILENYQEVTAVYGADPGDERFKFSLLRRRRPT